MIRVSDRGTRFAPVREDLTVGDDGVAWLVSLQPLDPVERAELGTFRTQLESGLLAEARRLDAAARALVEENGAGRGDLAVTVGDGDSTRTFFVRSVGAAPEAASSTGWEAELARWHASVRALTRRHAWSTLALATEAGRAPDGVTVRFALRASGVRPVRVLVDRSTFSLVDDEGALRYAGTPEPDFLWDSSGLPMDSLLVDFTLTPGAAGSVAFFGIADAALPARGSVHATLAIVTAEPDEALPYPIEQVELRTPPMAPPGAP